MSKLKIQVWKWKVRDDLLTVTTDTASGAGTRIFGPKMVPGDADLLCEFPIDVTSARSIVDDLELAEQEERDARRHRRRHSTS